MAQANVKEGPNVLAKIRDFFGSVFLESKKIVWPSREQLIQSTMVVLVVLLVLATFMAIADLSLTAFFEHGVDKVKFWLSSG